MVVILGLLRGHGAAVGLMCVCRGGKQVRIWGLIWAHCVCGGGTQQCAPAQARVLVCVCWRGRLGASTKDDCGHVWGTGNYSGLLLRSESSMCSYGEMANNVSFVKWV